MREKPTPFINLMPLQLILSRRALPARSCDHKHMSFMDRARFGARSAIDKAIMSVAHPAYYFKISSDGAFYTYMARWEFSQLSHRTVQR